MARYFFNVAGDMYRPDGEGTELTDNAAARRHGVLYGAQLMLDEAAALAEGKDINLEVSDDRGLVVFVLNIYVTLAPAGGHG